jgi:hypothetical protein
MKTWKHNTVVVILSICFSFIACDKRPEQPQFREEAIYLEFYVPTKVYPYAIIYGDNIMCTTNVQGTLTATEWNDIPNIIENVINGTYNYMVGVNDTITDAYRKVFGDDKVQIIVEKTSEYDNYKTYIYGSKTIYLNFDLFNIEQESGMPLVEAIFGAIGEINGFLPIFRDMKNIPLKHEEFSEIPYLFV